MLICSTESDSRQGRTPESLLLEHVLMIQTATFEPRMLETHCIVDARTPLEFSEDRIPGAINVPILTDPERIEIGIIYKEQGPLAARKRGLELTCHRFPSIAATVREAADGKPALVYCWRGGLRSESVAMLLDMTGYPAIKLKGGYKSFRNSVSAFFAGLRLPVQLIVLHGMTGSGKTEFLKRLAPERWTVIDLEGVARHRGSAFGSLGMGDQPSQKRFETTLWDAFRKAPLDRPIVVEGESKRIGRLTLPGNLYEVMAESTKIWCNVSVETRVKRLAAEYACKDFREPMYEALERIRKKLGGPHYDELKEALASWDVEAMAKGLIENYYDRLYYKVRRWEPEGEISLEDYQQAEEDLLKICSR